MSNKFQSVNNYVLLEMVDDSNQHIGEIALPERANKAPRWGRALSVGSGVPDANGRMVEPDVHEGDMAYVMSHGRQEIQLNALGHFETMHMCSALDVLAILEENMSLQPLGSYIEIEPLSTEESLEGIFLPESQKGLPTLAKVIRLGKGFVSLNGDRVPFQVKEGDIVAYNPLMTMICDVSPMHPEHKKDVRTLISHANIMGILEVESE